jgi:hypothetical protein
MGFNSAFKELNFKRLIDLNGKVIVQRILKKYDGRFWTEFIWLRIGRTSGIISSR